MRAAACIVALCLAVAAHAGVSVSVNTRTVQVKEIFYLTVRAEGTKIGQPVLPHANGLVINRTPASSSTSTSVQFINGVVQQTSAQEWIYEAWATQPGTLEIPPVKVTMGGREELSNPLSVIVQDGNAPIGAQPTQPQQPRRGQQQQGERREVTTDDIMLLEAKVTKQSIYEGEAILYEVNFCVLDQPGVSVRGNEGNVINLPTADGFYESEIQKNERVETRNGLSYEVNIFTRTMFPTKAGTLTIPGMNWAGRATFPTGLGMRTFPIERVTEPITIEVKPLPERPADFSGAVGRFTMKGELEGGVVEQGVPKKFIVTIAGEGNVDAIAKPTLPAMDWCHVSEPEVTSTTLSTPLEFEKHFAFTLTPMQPEKHQIPPVPFTFFAPEIGNYKTIDTKPVEVYVQPAKDTGPLVVAGGQSNPATADVQVLGSDLLPITTMANALVPARSSLPLNAVGFGAPPLAFAACLAFIRRRRKLATDIGYARGLRAGSRSRKRLQEAARSKDPAESIFKALSGFVGDKLNLPDAGMTSHDVRDAMERHGFTEALVQEYTQVLKACERQRYAGQAITPQETAALHDAAAQALEHLEREAGAKR